MSLMRCRRHDRTWDSDFHECCPTCEAIGIEVEQAENGWSAKFVGVPDDALGNAWGYAATEDEAITNLMRVAT